MRGCAPPGSCACARCNAAIGDATGYPHQRKISRVQAQVLVYQANTAALELSAVILPNHYSD
ncbi:hypothetical protein Y887_13830 [Xanthomonas pisi DSM 18956]|uniref:Uncharacterized protein n=1 Tax=Xanthomonas pisi TaxID=56457 RepID=A0A2S7D4E6_9XANT|nr:hypothetical protein Y887_13830 [Xanthomonas pisi DSM 18956]PPU68711.1 hypothetical protein XpiCFBP4643_09460 [Xanthomonas pisi]